MSIATVKGLCKAYPGFMLKDVSFNVEAGRITGFIGRNGAGKTTTIKSMLNLIHPDKGEIRFFDKPLQGNEAYIKQRIGYSTGSIGWYPRKKLKDVVEMERRFYTGWQESTYRRYLSLFSIDENKSPKELSEGMKVKCNLLIALSHGAELLILDEPTSGLDPFSRDELTDIFTELKKHGTAILFSTHILSDIEKCADDIVYISRGSIRSNLPKEAFLSRYGTAGETLEQTVLRMEKEERGDSRA